MDNLLYPKHSVKCNITGPSGGEKSCFLLQLFWIPSKLLKRFISVHHLFTMKCNKIEIFSWESTYEKIQPSKDSKWSRFLSFSQKNK